MHAHFVIPREVMTVQPDRQGYHGGYRPAARAELNGDGRDGRDDMAFIRNAGLEQPGLARTCKCTAENTIVFQARYQSSAQIIYGR